MSIPVIILISFLSATVPLIIVGAGFLVAWGSIKNQVKNSLTFESHQALCDKKQASNKLEFDRIYDMLREILENGATRKQELLDAISTIPTQSNG